MLPCVTLVTLLTLFYPVLALLPSVILCHPCYPLLPCVTLVTLSNPVLTHITIVTSCYPVLPLLPLLPLLPCFFLVTLCYPVLPLLPCVTLCYPVLPLLPCVTLVTLVTYTCQLFLRYKREIFILGLLGFLKTTRSFPKIPEEVRRRPKSSEDVRSLPKASSLPMLFTSKITDHEEGIAIYSYFIHGFRSLHGSELTYFWKLCQAGRQELTFFNQA